MTPDEIAAIRQRADKATPGPWTAVCHSVDEGDSYFLGWDIEGPQEAYRGMVERGADAKFMAAARADIPALLAEVERLTKERDEARAAVKQMVSIYDIPKNVQTLPCGHPYTYKIYGQRRNYCALCHQEE